MPRVGFRELFEIAGAARARLKRHLVDGSSPALVLLSVWPWTTIAVACLVVTTWRFLARDPRRLCLKPEGAIVIHLPLRHVDNMRHPQLPSIQQDLVRIY